MSETKTTQDHVKSIDATVADEWMSELRKLETQRDALMTTTKALIGIIERHTVRRSATVQNVLDVARDVIDEINGH